MRVRLSLPLPIGNIQPLWGQAAPRGRGIVCESWKITFLCDLFQKKETGVAWDSGCFGLPALKSLSCPSPCAGVFVASLRLKCSCIVPLYEAPSVLPPSPTHIHSVPLLLPASCMSMLGSGNAHPVLMGDQSFLHVPYGAACP